MEPETLDLTVPPSFKTKSAQLNLLWEKIEVQYAFLIKKHHLSFGEGISVFEFVSGEGGRCNYHYYYEGTEQYNRIFIKCGWKPEEIKTLEGPIACVMLDDIGTIRRMTN